LFPRCLLNLLSRRGTRRNSLDEAEFAKKKIGTEATILLLLRLSQYDRCARRYLSKFTPPPYLGALRALRNVVNIKTQFLPPTSPCKLQDQQPRVGGARGEAWGQAGGCAQGCGGVVWGWERGGGGMYSIAIKRSVWLTLALHRDPGFSKKFA
jgi:hypothetical protein